jgi:sortase A
MVRVLFRILGSVMVLVGLGLVVLFFVGPPGGTAGSIPTEAKFPSTDAGAPADGTLYLTVPKIGLRDLEVHNSSSEALLDESAIHLPETGFPWQPGSNTYILGHRLGYFGTDSFLVYFRLNELDPPDEISLGREYAYRIRQQVVGPEDVGVMDPVAGRSAISLRTRPLPNYSERLIHEELVSYERFTEAPVSTARTGALVSSEP